MAQLKKSIPSGPPLKRAEQRGQPILPGYVAPPPVPPRTPPAPAPPAPQKKSIDYAPLAAAVGITPEIAQQYAQRPMSPEAIDRLEATMREVGTELPEDFKDLSTDPGIKKLLILWKASETYSKLPQSRKEEFKNTVVLPLVGNDKQFLDEFIQGIENPPST